MCSRLDETQSTEVYVDCPLTRKCNYRVSACGLKITRRADESCSCPLLGGAKRQFTKWLLNVNS